MVFFNSTFPSFFSFVKKCYIMYIFEKDFKLFSKDHNVSQSVLDDYTRSINNSIIEPTIIEERQLHATQISVFSRMFMDRILFLGCEVNSDVANIINAQMLYLASTNPDKTISLYINSPGGSVNAGLAIYDVINFITPDVSTTCIGMAASMGAVLLSSGAKGKRKSLKHSDIMIHQPLSGIHQAQASDIEIHWNEVKKCKNTLYNILAENCNKTYEEIEQACDRDNWFTAQEAIDFGLIDDIITKK